eukprot:1137380-Pelagomonas_calceolata.AAC.3
MQEDDIHCSNPAQPIIIDEHTARMHRERLMGLPLILRYIVRAGTCGLSSGLYASDALSSTQVSTGECSTGAGRAV